jgi:hypothetical protein
MSLSQTTALTFRNGDEGYTAARSFDRSEGGGESFMTVRTGMWKAATVTLVASAAVLSQTSAAWAGGSGVTTNGYSNIDKTAATTTPLCLQNSTGGASDPRTSITLFNTGTFNNDTTVYATRTQFDATTSYYFGPGGTYSDSQCTVPYAVPGTLKIIGNSIHCDSGSGGAAVPATYQRTNSTYTITTTSSIVCAGTSTPSYSSSFTFTGTQLACTPTPDNCGSGSNSTEFSGTYTQSP